MDKIKMSEEPTIEELLEIFDNSNINFAFVVRADDEGEDLLVSHRELEPLGELIRQSSAFAGHEAVFIEARCFVRDAFFCLRA